MDKFENLFHECNNIPQENQFNELLSINLGIFRSSVSESILTGGQAHFPTVFELFLIPYFTSRKRCLGIGEYFKYGDAKFKVIGAFPSYGVVGKNTAIYCSQILSTHQVAKLKILPLNGPLVTQNTFRDTISPFFGSRLRHVSVGQYLYMGRQEYMVVECLPNNGTVNTNVQFHFEGEPLCPVQALTLSPYFEELHVSYRTLSGEQLTEEIYTFYLLPFSKALEDWSARARTY